MSRRISELVFNEGAKLNSLLLKEVFNYVCCLRDERTYV